MVFLVEEFDMEVKQLYYNIYSRRTDAFLGTVNVKIIRTPAPTPVTRAVRIACDILGANGAPDGIKAILSTEKQFNLYGLNR